MIRFLYIVLPFSLGVCFAGNLSAQEGRHDLQELSLDSLLAIEISTAAKYGQKVGEAPASVTIITSEDIERYGYRTLDEVFLAVRGFYVSNDRNYVYLGSRGFSRPTDYNNRILLLMNGHPINENIWGSASIGTELGVDLRIVERIEIVRGTGSALYGTGAMFAVINIITKKGVMLDGVRLSAEMGSYGRRQVSAEVGKELGSGVEVLFSGLWTETDGQDLYYKEYDDPSTNNGIAEGLDWDRHYGVLTKVAYKDLTLQGMLASREKGIPTGAFEIVFNDPAAKTLDEHRFVELLYDGDISADKHVTVRGYAHHYGYEGSYPYSVVYFDTSNGTWLGGESQFRWDPLVNNRLIIGAEYKNSVRAQYRARDVNTTYFNIDSPFNVFSLYLQDEYQITETLSLTAGLRRDEYSTAGSSTTPRGAVVYHPVPSGTLKLLYGEAFRAPSIHEVGYEDPLTGFKANPGLRPEKIRTMEAIWEQRLSDWLFGVVAFYDYDMKDLIDQTVDPSDSLMHFQNVSRVKANGLLLELNARLGTGLSGYMSYTFQQAEDADLKKRLTNSPDHTVKLGLTSLVFTHFDMGMEMLYETERLTVYGTTTDPYLVTNLNVSTKRRPKGDTILTRFLRHARLSLLVRNVLNVTYQTPGGFEHRQSGITQNGRNVTVRLEHAF